MHRSQVKFLLCLLIRVSLPADASTPQAKPQCPARADLFHGERLRKRGPLGPPRVLLATPIAAAFFRLLVYKFTESFCAVHEERILSPFTWTSYWGTEEVEILPRGHTAREEPAGVTPRGQSKGRQS